MDERAGRFVVMGVSGVGKTRVGLRWPQALGARFVEGTTSPPANRARWHGCTPLEDEVAGPG
jgi:gluconate kinase